MATEHTPRPGLTWGTHYATWDCEQGRIERVVPDDAPEPRPNRAARRAADRATRRTNTPKETTP
ncbi:hypothetical protein [Kitasatospora sp. NPDC004289]